MRSNRGDETYPIENPDEPGDSDLAIWCVETARVLLGEPLTTNDVSRLHAFAVAALRVAGGGVRHQLIEIAILTSVLLALDSRSFPTDFVGWVEEPSRLGMSRIVALSAAALAAAFAKNTTESHRQAHALVHQYQKYLLDGWDRSDVEDPLGGFEALVYEASFLLCSLLVFDATALPAALNAAARLRRRLAAPSDGDLLIQLRRSIHGSTPLGDLVPAPLLSNGVHTAYLVRECAKILASSTLGYELRILELTKYRNVLSAVYRELFSFESDGAAAVQLEAIRLLRVLGTAEGSGEDLDQVVEYLRNAVESPRFDPDEVRSDLICAQVDQFRLSGDASWIDYANELANELLNEEGPCLAHPETMESLSLARFYRYLTRGLLADLEEAHAYNAIARDQPGVSDAMRVELLMNGGAIRRRLADHGYSGDHATGAFDDYSTALDLLPSTSTEMRRSFAHNIVSLFLSAERMSEDAKRVETFRSATRELRRTAAGEPRYLISAANAMLTMRENGPSSASLGALAALVEAMCNARTNQDVTSAFVAMSKCIEEYPEWRGPDGPLLNVLAALRSRELGAVQHMDVSSILLEKVLSDPDGARFKGFAYHEFLLAAKQLLSAQVSGADRRHWLERLGGMPSSAIVELSAEQPDTAIQIAEGARAIIGFEALSLLTRASEGGPEVAEALAELRAGRVAADFAADPAAVHKARLRMQDAQTRLRVLSDTHSPSPLRASVTTPLTDLQRAAGSGVTCYLALNGGQLVVVAVGADMAPVEILRTSPRSLIPAATEFLNRYSERRVSFTAWASSIRAVSAELWDSVIGPLTQELGTEDRLTLIPCGGLSLLPMHLAWRYEDGQRRHAIEDLVVAYSPGLSFSTGRSADRLRADGGFFGATSSKGQLRWLPCEREAITNHLGPRFEIDWAGDDSTPASILDGAERARILHVAAHGEARLHSRDSGFVDLTLGRLDEQAILGRRLDNLDLVVLSACDSGSIDQELPDEIRGLPLAFIAAGARAVISTAWPCDDLVTAWLMSELYEQIADGADPPAALRAAQLRIKAGTPIGAPDAIQREISGPWREIYSHEVYWGAFSVLSTTTVDAS